MYIHTSKHMTDNYTCIISYVTTCINKELSNTNTYYNFGSRILLVDLTVHSQSVQVMSTNNYYPT